VSRGTADLYTAAADALAAGRFATATAALRQIRDDFALSSDRATLALDAAAERLAAFLSHPLATSHPRDVADLRIVAHDLAQEAES
jgi:hypothetical protein